MLPFRLAYCANCLTPDVLVTLNSLPVYGDEPHHQPSHTQRNAPEASC